MEERERVAAIVCDRVSYTRTRVHACTCIYALITSAHTYTRKHTDARESKRKLEYVPYECAYEGGGKGGGGKRHVEGWQRVAGKRGGGGRFRGRLRGNVGR